MPRATITHRADTPQRFLLQGLTERRIDIIR